jgi:hypothetical protein
MPTMAPHAPAAVYHNSCILIEMHIDSIQGASRRRAPARESTHRGRSGQSSCPNLISAIPYQLQLSFKSGSRRFTLT